MQWHAETPAQQIGGEAFDLKIEGIAAIQTRELHKMTRELTADQHTLAHPYQSDK